MNKIDVFSSQEIRKIWYDNEWYFSVVDIIKILTESENPRNYWNMLKKRDIELYTICVQLKLRAPDNKMRETDCVNNKSAFRLIQSIPSKNAESLKLWLAQLAQDRIDEIQNPELGIQRNLNYYKKKGYDDEWIKKRKFSITTRKKLTDEWKNRGIQENKDFAILTNIIHNGTFDLTVKEHKNHKTLSNKDELRDHMSDIELALISLSEATTTEITKSEDSKGFEKLSNDSKEGAEFGRDARVKIENRLNKSIVSEKNYLEK